MRHITPLSLSKPEMITGAKFLAGIAIIYSVIRYGFYPYLDLSLLRLYTAHLSSILLSVTGNIAFVADGANPIIIFNSGAAEIIDLCSGGFELVILASILFPTWEFGLKKRFYGFILGTITVLILNPIRVFLTLLFSIWWGWDFGEIVHGVFFKLTLLIVIAGYYYVWFYKFMVDK